MMKSSVRIISGLCLVGWALAAGAQQKAFFCLGLSPFRDGQSPATGVLPSIDQIREDIQKMKPYTENVRCYGNNGTLYEFPRLCTEEGVGLFLGVWLDGNATNNRATIDRLKEQLQGPYTDCIQGVVVGSECFLRYFDDPAHGLAPATLVSFINEVKAVTTKPVATAESFWHLQNRYNDGGKDIGDACDYILYHVHPYWNNMNAENSTDWVMMAYDAMKALWPNKEAICGETGYPTAGKSNPLNLATSDKGPSVPSEASQTTFLKALVEKNRTANIKYMWFSAFDEQWKATDGESNACNCGAHWGLWNTNRTPKSTVEAFEAVAAQPRLVRPIESTGNITVHASSINLTIVEPRNASLKIYGVRGEVVRDFGARVRLAPAGQITMDISQQSLAAGSYVVHFHDGLKSYSKNVTIQ